MTARLSALVGHGYDQMASDFARAADRLVYAVLARPLATAIAARLDGDDGVVLDVAAGSGALGRAFARVVALDLSGNQLAANRAAGRVRGDAAALPFRHDAFAAAGCAFGINHVRHPERVVAEMARVAPVVGVSTWRRPERPFTPRQIVHAAIERQVGRGRTRLGNLLDRFSDQVGSVQAVTRLLGCAGLEGHATTVDVEVPWPGVDAFLDYRLAMPSTPGPADPAALRAEVTRLLADLPADQLIWRPALVVAVGRR